MKNNVEVVAVEIAGEVITDYIRDMGLEGQDHVFIQKVGKHLEVGGVTFRCVK